MATTKHGDVIKMTADNDTYSNNLSNKTIVSVVLDAPAASKVYSIKQGGTSGPVLWLYTTSASPAEHIQENVNFNTGGGLHFDTDDAGTAFTLLLNIGK
jgi:hypothetical protein